MKLIAIFFGTVFCLGFTTDIKAQTKVTVSNVTILTASTAALGSTVAGGAIGVSLPISACPSNQLLITVDTAGAFNSKNIMTAQLVLDPTGGLGNVIGSIFGGGLGTGLGTGLGNIGAGLGFGITTNPPINIGTTQPGGSPIDVIGGLFGGFIGGLTGGGLAGGGLPGSGLPNVNTKTQTIIGTIPADIANGTYYLRVISSNPKDTSANYTSSISIQRATKPTLSLSCNGDSVVLKSGFAIGETYKWSTGSTTSSIKVPNATQTYSLTVTNTSGCKATSDTLIKSNKIIKVCSDQMMTLSSFVTAKSYLWSTNSNQNSIEIDNAQAAYKLISLSTANPFSCATLYSPECSIPVVNNANQLQGEAFVPNVFTPNNDNVNDLFVINNAENNIKSVAIYNAWGVKVYETEIISNAWNGCNKSGVECAVGTYYYVLETLPNGGNNISAKGFFQLLR